MKGYCPQTLTVHISNRTHHARTLHYVQDERTIHYECTLHYERKTRADERGRSTSNSGRRVEHFQSWTCHLGGNTKHLFLDPPLVPEQPSCTQTTGDIHFHLYIITTNNSLIKNNQQTTDPYGGVRDTFFLIFNLTDKYICD